MYKKIKLASLFVLFAFASFGQDFEKTKSFYPNSEMLKKEPIEWGYLSVPENWDTISGNNIKLAVAVIKSTAAADQKSSPIVVLEGGPGAGAINSVWSWVSHPLRATSDIVLIDIRGTGLSEPRLCPDLGNEFLKILAKNQTPAEDELDKAKAALKCQRKLLIEEIDISAYHSGNIAKDLHSLKNYLQYDSWTVYGISYGTYMAQVYANNFPADVANLILDSPIADIEAYYTKNTINYSNSLAKVFEDCKNDPDCNASYPDLENKYYETIEKLQKQPITVAVDKNIIEEETFTYNAEDFKIAIHQALYNQQLIEVLPLLIYEFNNENKEALSELVVAFSGALSLDYGMYYCVSCNETIPNNSLEVYSENNKNTKLSNGIAFYKSDFVVCEQWNAKLKNNIQKDSTALNIQVPTLLFTGKYDPITPETNGEQLASKIETSYIIHTKTTGHASSFSPEAKDIISQFITAPHENPNAATNLSQGKISFINNINVDKRISKMGNSFGAPDILFFGPLLIALLVCIITIFGYLIPLLFKKKKRTNVLMKLLLISCSVLGVIVLFGFVNALIYAVDTNFYTLAFGIPKQFEFLFTLLTIFLVTVCITVVYFIIRLRKIPNTGVVTTILFSNVLILLYFFYWNILSF
ncbi:alpha/beta hydrolase [Kordia jejudonensis]|uniref:alpha/beta hydrolase n=1 Tax=Kordia jejudonensis TaxID=1348245 RepID=UPI000629315A|nr:alpha/beta fold hydrolase [Kordia jejudonensis]